jgi:hypothetical protein
VTSRPGVAAILIGATGNSYATLIPPLVALPIYIGIFDPEGKAGALGIALGLMAGVLMVFVPILGAMSDRTTSLRPRGDRG